MKSTTAASAPADKGENGEEDAAEAFARDETGGEERARVLSFRARTARAVDPPPEKSAREDRGIEADRQVDADRERHHRHAADRQHDGEARAEGEATIIAEAFNGVTASFPIRVQPAPDSVTAVRMISEPASSS